MKHNKNATQANIIEQCVFKSNIGQLGHTPKGQVIEDGQRDKQRDKQTERQTMCRYRPAHRQTIHRYRQTDRQYVDIDRQTDRQST